MTYRTTIGILMFALSAVCVGCASGRPAFVKISPTGRFVVYEDCCYPTTYVYDTREKRKSSFPGRVACMDENVMLLVLYDEPAGGKMPCRLMYLWKDGPTVCELPPLSMGDHPLAKVVFLGENSADLLGLLYDDLDKEPAAAVQLPYRAGRWEKASIPGVFAARTYHRLPEPFGLSLSGYAYPLPGTQTYSCDVEKVYIRRCGDTWCADSYYILHSPYRDYTVTIDEPNDVWRRVWLTEKNGNRVLLLDKNDVPLHVVQGIGMCTALLFSSVFHLFAPA